MGVAEFLVDLGDAIEDPEEESFLLFTTPIPSSNLGFVDSSARNLELSINGQDITIQQSPGLLNSTLSGGTTGAVLWKVTPAFALWISGPGNALFQHSVLSSDSLVIELGTGISGLVALALAPKVRKYIATDQVYALKTLRANVDTNLSSKSTKYKGSKTSKLNIEVLELDWEESKISNLPSLVPELADGKGLDAVIACDCIYNEALIPSFVNACAELCFLRSDSERPTLCIVAQQLRSDLVFEEWLQVFHRRFSVWRLPDAMLNEQLKEGHGFVVHVGVLKKTKDIHG